MKALSRKSVAAKCDVSKSQIDRWTREERYSYLNFPLPFELSDGKPALREDLIDAFLVARATRKMKRPPRKTQAPQSTACTETAA